MVTRLEFSSRQAGESAGGGPSSSGQPAAAGTAATGKDASGKDASAERILVGISACLLGNPVRYDGTGKRNRFLVEDLGAHVRWVSVCPEVGAGMPVPRPTLRLVGARSEPRLIESKSGRDWTEPMRAFVARELERLAPLALCGFVVKRASPSCGLERVKLYEHGEVPRKTATGLFTNALVQRFPLLPIEEDGRLTDPLLREGFLDAVFAYGRWRRLVQSGASPAALQRFHRCNKYLLHSHSPAHLRQLGQLVAAGPAAELDTYASLFMRALRARATPRKHYATLARLARHLRRCVSATSYRTVCETLADYRAGYVARSVPLALLRHHAREHDISYLAEQSYLEPYPKQLQRASP